MQQSIRLPGSTEAAAMPFDDGSSDCMLRRRETLQLLDVIIQERSIRTSDSPSRMK
jgi:hypothetical protein